MRFRVMEIQTGETSIPTLASAGFDFLITEDSETYLTEDNDPLATEESV